MIAIRNARCTMSECVLYRLGFVVGGGCRVDFYLELWKLSELSQPHAPSILRGAPINSHVISKSPVAGARPSSEASKAKFQKPSHFYNLSPNPPFCSPISILGYVWNLGPAA